MDDEPEATQMVQPSDQSSSNPGDSVSVDPMQTQDPWQWSTGRPANPPAPLTAGMGPIVSAEIEELKASGSTVRTITADTDAVEAMGPNSLDPRRRKVAAEHGLRQGLNATF